MWITRALLCNCFRGGNKRKGGMFFHGKPYSSFGANAFLQEKKIKISAIFCESMVKSFQLLWTSIPTDFPQSKNLFCGNPFCLPWKREMICCEIAEKLVYFSAFPCRKGKVVTPNMKLLVPWKTIFTFHVFYVEKWPHNGFLVF